MDPLHKLCVFAMCYHSCARGGVEALEGLGVWSYCWQSHNVNTRRPSGEELTNRNG